jgi:hypothetical protein
MAEPNSREAFIQYCLRQLGSPVININVTPAQCNDRVDDSLTIWREFHYDAVQRTYLRHKVTAEDMVNHWIPCGDDIQSVVRVLQYDEANMNIFDIRYQLRLQDFYNFSNVSMQHYQTIVSLISNYWVKILRIAGNSLEPFLPSVIMKWIGQSAAEPCSKTEGSTTRVYPVGNSIAEVQNIQLVLMMI